MANTTSGEKKSREFTGRHMLIVVFAFFGVIITVNLIMATFAVSTWSGLVSNNAFVEGRDYNQELARGRTQSALGWTSTFVYEKGRLVFQIKDKDGRPLTGLQVKARVGRPAHDDEDRQLTLTDAGKGRYGAGIALAPGQWEADIVAGRGGKTYRQIFRLELKSAG